MRTIVSSRRNLVAFVLVALFALPLAARETTEVKITLKTALAGPAFNGEQPKGGSEFQMEGALRRLFVEVGNINLPNGSVLDVYLNDAKIGVITIQNRGGALLLSTAAGQAVPSVSIGTSVGVSFGATSVLSGKF